jgi:hypothetical protein
MHLLSAALGLVIIKQAIQGIAFIKTYAKKFSYCRNFKKMVFIALEASIYYHFQVKWYLDMLQHRASASFIVSRFKVSKVYAVLSKSAVSE